MLKHFSEDLKSHSGQLRTPGVRFFLKFVTGESWKHILSFHDIILSPKLSGLSGQLQVVWGFTWSEISFFIQQSIDDNYYRSFLQLD